MANNNIKLGITTAAIYLVGVTLVFALIAWMGSSMSLGGIEKILTAKYALGISIGFVASFLCGYFYNDLLSQQISRFALANPEIPMDFTKPICKSRLLSRYFGCISTVCLVFAVLLFALSGETYIEGLCVLLSLGFTTLFFTIFYHSKIRETMREHFKSQHI